MNLLETDNNVSLSSAPSSSGDRTLREEARELAIKQATEITYHEDKRGFFDAINGQILPLGYGREYCVEFAVNFALEREREAYRTVGDQDAWIPIDRKNLSLRWLLMLGRKHGDDREPGIRLGRPDGEGWHIIDETGRGTWVPHREDFMLGEMPLRVPTDASIPRTNKEKPTMGNNTTRDVADKKLATEVEIQLPLTWDWTDDGGAEFKDANGEEVLPKTIVAALNATSAVEELGQIVSKELAAARYAAEYARGPFRTADEVDFHNSKVLGALDKIEAALANVKGDKND